MTDQEFLEAIAHRAANKLYEHMGEPIPLGEITPDMRQLHVSWPLITLEEGPAARATSPRSLPARKELPKEVEPIAEAIVNGVKERGFRRFATLQLPIGGAFGVWSAPFRACVQYDVIHDRVCYRVDVLGAP